MKKAIVPGTLKPKQQDRGGAIEAPLLLLQARPLRGHARSYKDFAGLRWGPVGAGVPAKGPAQAYFYFRASRIRLNGVCVARRNRPNPASSNTARNRASPACAPSPNPTSCDNEFGVQINVDAA